MLLAFLVFAAGVLLAYLGVTGASVKDVATGFFATGELPA